MLGAFIYLWLLCLLVEFTPLLLCNHFLLSLTTFIGVKSVLPDVGVASHVFFSVSNWPSGSVGMGRNQWRVGTLGSHSREWAHTHGDHLRDIMFISGPLCYQLF